MFRTLATAAIVGLIVLMSAELQAGGPPQLCLPIDGVTKNSIEECSERLVTGLGDTLWTRTPPSGVKFEQHGGQWYALLYLSGQRDVKLSDIDAVLEGSEFAVPRSKLRFVGQVQLEVEVPESAHEALLKECSSIKHVKVEHVSRSPRGMLVTFVLPESDRRNVFQLLERSPTESGESTSSITVESLPSYTALCDLMTQHHARLSDVVWSAQWSCSTFGSLAVAAR